MAPVANDPYTTLGLERTADAAQIKQAYFALVRTHPPERDPEMFKRIRAAYEQLRDPVRRLETDMLLFQPWVATARRRRPPELQLALQIDDLIVAARALSDLDRDDWREHFVKVTI